MTPAPFDPFAYAHAHRREIVWMSQNTNHLVPPEVVGHALRQAIEERRYEGSPIAAGEPELLQLVREDFGLPDGFVTTVSAGATETLYMLTRALLSPGDEVIATDPSYLIIHKFIELSGARTVNLDVYAPPYRLTADRIRAALTPKTRMILLIDPLNPLGSAYPREELRAIAEIARDHKLLLLHDVTYRDFKRDPANAADFAPEQTITIWSAAKNCGLAGLRVGGLIARPELARPILRYNTNDLGVNVLAQIATIAALRTKPTWIESIRSTTRENGARIRAAAESVPGVRVPVFPSDANMFVLDILDTGLTPEAVQEDLLLRHGVFVRAGNYLSPKFGHRFVRVSFSNPPAEVDRFVQAFPRAIEALRSPRPRA